MDQPPMFTRYVPVNPHLINPFRRAARFSGRTRSLPVSFEAASQWPHCAEIIMRIHNQGGVRRRWFDGHLGSLWGFILGDFWETWMKNTDDMMMFQVSGRWKTQKL